MNIAFVCMYVSEDIDAKRPGVYQVSPPHNIKILGLAKALRNQGHRVFLVSNVLGLSKTGQWFPGATSRVDGLDVIYSSTWDQLALNYVTTFISGAKNLFSLHRRVHLDAVIFVNFLPTTSLPAWLVAKCFRLPLIVDYEDGHYRDPEIRPVMRQVINLLEAIVSCSLRGAIVVAPELERRVPTNNVYLCPGFLHEDIAKSTPLSARPTRRGKVYITYAGAFDRTHGVDIFLDACRKLHRHNVEIHICGYGPLEKEIERSAQAIGEIEIVKHGFLPRSEFLRLLFRSDILVNPQRVEGTKGPACFPVKLIEYMATGNIVITSKVGGLDHRFDDRLILYEGDNATSLGNVLDSVLETPERFWERGAKARKYVLENFTIEAVGQELDKLLTLAVSNYDHRR